MFGCGRCESCFIHIDIVNVNVTVTRSNVDTRNTFLCLRWSPKYSRKSAWQPGLILAGRFGDGDSHSEQKENHKENQNEKQTEDNGITTIES